MKKRNIIVLMIGMILITCCFSCAKDEVRQNMDDYFQALHDLDFQAAAIILGDEHFYDSVINEYENSESYLQSSFDRAYLRFVYQNISYEILSVQNNGNTATVAVNVTAYDVRSVLSIVQQQLADIISSEQYGEMSLGEQYVYLSDAIESIYASVPEQIEPKSNQITLEMTMVDGVWQIIPNQQLFDAIAGSD